MKTMKTKLKTGDKVIVTAGKDKGTVGPIKALLTKKNRVLVEGANIIVKHQKPNPQRGVEGGLVKREGPMDISNIAIFNEQTGKADKVSYSVLESGEKVRVYRSTQENID